MEKLSMCRICLATDLRLCSIASHLRDMYETITTMRFKTEDRRPLVACYICRARLQNCYRLRKSCLRSEDLFTDMLSSSVIQPQDVLCTNKFRVVSVLHFSIQGHVLRNSTVSHVKEEALEEIIHDAELNQLCDAEDIKLEIEDTILEEYERNGAGLSSQLADSESEGSNDPGTDIPVFKKLTESDSYLVMEPENKNIVFDELAETSNIHEKNETRRQQEDNKVMAHYEVNKQTSKRNTCSINKSLRSTARLESRTCTSTDEKRFNCDTFQCVVCNKCFSSKTKLTHHMYTHTDEKPFQCSVCNKCFISKQYLTRHTNTHTEEKPFQCDVCNKCFKIKRILTQHMYTHAVEKPFQCDVCNKCFISKQYLTGHMNTHTEEKPFQCDVCNKCFKIKRTLTQHMYTHAVEKPFQCDVCKKCYKSKKILSNHMYTHTREKPFQCSVCNKCFKSKQVLTNHMYTHTREKPFQCEICSKYFCIKKSLTQHMYMHTDEKPFQCSVCNKCFNSKQNLTRHMNTHTGEKPFQCEICSKYYCSKKSLTQHMYTHTDEKPFQCDVCNKCFKYKHVIKNHMNTHTLES